MKYYFIATDFKIIVHVVFFYSMGWPKTLLNGPTSVYSYEALNISPAVGHYIFFTLIASPNFPPNGKTTFLVSGLQHKLDSELVYSSH